MAKTATKDKKKTGIESVETQENGSTAVVVSDVNAFTEHLEKVPHGKSGIRILKAKITKHDTLEVSYEEMHDDGKNEVTKICDGIVHQDLRDSFDKLKPHLAYLCDLKESVRLDIEDCESLPGLKVNSFSIGGNNEHEGVSLSGSKQIGNKLLNLNTPFQKWDDEFEPYAYVSELGLTIENCIHEVQQYLTGKHAVKQMTMDFSEGEKED